MVGTVLMTAGLVAIILPLVDGRQQHWPAWAWASLAAAVPILAAFAAHQARRRQQGRAPLVDLTALAGRAIRAGLLATGVFYCAMASFFIVLALYLQEGRGMSALGSGAMFTAVGAGYLAASLVPARLTARLGRQWPALGGLVMAAGYAALALVVTGAGTRGVLWLTGPLLVTGIGMGMLTAPLTGIVLAQVAPQHVGTVSGLQSTTVQLGNSLGVAVIGVVFFGALAGGFGHAFGTALAWLTVLPLAAAVAIQFVPGPPGRPAHRGTHPPNRPSSGGQHGLDDAVGPPVEGVVEARRLGQRTVMADHEPGLRPAGQHQIPQPGGVTAVVRPAEADGDPLAEERGPGHGELPVREAAPAPGAGPSRRRHPRYPRGRWD